MNKNIIVREQKGDTLLDHLLYYRGITDPIEKEKFLNPNYETGVHDPFLLAGMDKAVERIEKALQNKEKIVVYSDFDADGIPGAVAFAHFLKEIGHTNVEHYIPHRHNEGFGFHSHAVDAIAKAGGQLIITIDCGISDIKAAAHAKELGIDLIITDHHMTKESLPQAYAVIDPKREDCAYPEKMLCGSGVIFKVIQGVLAKNRYGMKEGREKWYLDMVGIATLSDMVPLVGENRIFAKYGLTVLQKSPRPGLAHLLANLKVNQRNLTEDDVQFMITPRINVASRMGDPRDAFLLLSTSDFSEADRLVHALNDLNDERKTRVAVIVKEIKKKLGKKSTGSDVENVPVIVMGNPDWSPALLGLVATSIVRDYGKSTYLWGRAEDGNLKGSWRSDGKTDTLSLMEKVSQNSPDFFIAFGGHIMAGGFSLTSDHIHTFEEKMLKAYEEINVKGNDEKDQSQSFGLVEVDRRMNIDDVNWITWQSIEKLAPFGEGNPKPLFLFENVTLAEFKKFGKAKDHLEYVFKNSSGKTISAISFFATEAVQYKKGDTISFIATFEKSMYKNFPELRLRMVEVIEN